MSYKIIICTVSLLLILIVVFMGHLDTVFAGDGIWTGNGPSGNIQYALAVDPTNPMILYAGTYEDAGLSGDIFKSVNGGVSWSAVITNVTGVTAIVIDPITPTIIYAGTLNGGIRKSTNAGGDWISASGGVSDLHNTHAMAIAPTAPSTLYAGTSSRIYKSTNGGESWGSVKYHDDGDSFIVIDPVTPTTVYVVTDERVFKSINAGEDWTEITNGLPRAPNGQLRVDTLAIAPATPNTLYMAGGSYFYKSTNSGESWASVSDDLPTGFGDVLKFAPHESTTLYTGTSVGAYKSINGGKNWTALTTDGLTDTTLNTLAFAQTAPTTIYAGTGNGVFALTLNCQVFLPLVVRN